LVVDCDAGDTPSEGDWEAGRVALEQLACPSIAILRSDSRGAGFADLFDVVVSTTEQLETLLDTVRRRPIAAMALVQLLRHSERLSVHEALIAESLVYSTLQSGPEFDAWRRGREERPPPSSLEPAVLTERSGPTLTLTLNRPRRHNAFSADMRDGLAEALRVVVADPSIEEVVLRGAGPSFCSGGDLDEFGTFPDPATAHAVRSTRNPGRLLAACSERVRVHVHGACVGAGVELPAFTHRVVAARGAFFQLPEVGMGLVPGAGGTASLPRRIGRQRSAWLALSGERIDVETALAWGVVDEIED
jgi:enoyl-CoA hydratase/carnithine racemase